MLMNLEQENKNNEEESTVSGARDNLLGLLLSS